MSANCYLQKMELLSQNAEAEFLCFQRRTCFSTSYPFNIFPLKELEQIEFAPLTIFYGGNGSGKTTLLNIIAEKAGLTRHTPFNSSALFSEYVQGCQLITKTIPRSSQILTSDDVFDYLLNLRHLNEGIDARREDLFREYTNRKYADYQLRSLQDYEEWKEHYDARMKSQSQFVRERLMRNADMASNGESAMGYFLEHITEPGLYLLDEPENSLSISRQQELSQYLQDSVRFFGCQIILATHAPVLLAMENALIYDLDALPVTVKKWTELENVRKYFNFFLTHRDEFMNENE